MHNYSFTPWVGGSVFMVGFTKNIKQSPIHSCLFFTPSETWHLRKETEVVKKKLKFALIFMLCKSPWSKASIIETGITLSCRLMHQSFLSNGHCPHVQALPYTECSSTAHRGRKRIEAQSRWAPVLMHYFLQILTWSFSCFVVVFSSSSSSPPF